MCAPDIPEPEPTPEAPPSPSKTATGINSRGYTGSSGSASSQGADRRGIDALRVDLNVPEATGTSGGGFGSLLARLF